MNIINGPDEMLLMGLHAGADGGIGTTYNFILKLIRGIHDNFKAGKQAEAFDYQQQVAKTSPLLSNFLLYLQLRI